LVLATPSEAGDWWIANGPSNTSEHRRAQVRKDGDPVAPFAQRYAIDFARVCDGKVFLNKGRNNTDYCGYGSKVLSVADAQVLISKDGIPDNSPGSIVVKLSKDTLLGNYVVLLLGSGRVAVYAHLKPGTVLVKSGDSVRRGQEMARVGTPAIPTRHTFTFRYRSKLQQRISRFSRPIPSRICLTASGVSERTRKEG
jgi:murein DD-endopeptidase